jgi:hypothetical protein
MEMPLSQRSMWDRMKGAAMLDVATYEEVEADASATVQAAGVVAIVAVCSAVGAWSAGGRGIFGALIAAFASWLLWSAVTYLIGDKVLGGTASWGELLRTLGFAQTPGILFIVGVVPILSWPILFAAGIWMLVAGVIAIRQALDFSTGRAIGTALLGWVVIMIVHALF